MYLFRPVVAGEDPGPVNHQRWMFQHLPFLVCKTEVVAEPLPSLSKSGSVSKAVTCLGGRLAGHKLYIRGINSNFLHMPVQRGSENYKCRFVLVKSSL